MPLTRTWEKKGMSEEEAKKLAGELEKNGVEVELVVKKFGVD